MRDQERLALFHLIVSSIVKVKNSQEDYKSAAFKSQQLCIFLWNMFTWLIEALAVVCLWGKMGCFFPFLTPNSF